jgi:hypothetical protein
MFTLFVADLATVLRRLACHRCMRAARWRQGKSHAFAAWFLADKIS